MAIRAQDTCQTGGRGSPNAISPASDGENYTQQNGSATAAFTGSSITFTGSTNANQLTLGTQTFIDIDVLLHSTAAGNDTIGVFARWQSAANYYRADYNPVSGLLTITMRKSNAETVLASTNVGQPTTPGWNLHFSAQGVSTNDLKVSWWDDNGSDDGWILMATDLSFRTAALVGIYAKAGNSADVMEYDSFVAQDPSPFPNPPTPPTSVPDLPYGNTYFVKSQTITFLPQQAITDLLGIGLGAWLRYQLQWKVVEPNADQSYNWSYLDWAVTLCNSYGIRAFWPIQAPPSGYLTIRATDGSTAPAPGQVASTLTTAIAAGVPTTTLQVAALSGSLANGAGYTVDTKPNQENLLVVGNYGPGATAITVTNLSGGTWTPANNHGIGTTTATTGGQFASASAWATFITAVCNRYNGTVNSPYSGYPMLLDAVGLGNEDYDLSVLGVGNNQPARDILSQWLVPVANACYPIIRAALPNAYIVLNAVRKSPNNALLHQTNWTKNLYTYGGGLSAAWRADPKTVHDFHAYWDGVLNLDGSPQNDPTIDTFNSDGSVNDPSVQREVATLLGIARAYQSHSQVWCTEFGWNIANATTDKYVSDSVVFTPAQDAAYRLALLEKLRTGGAAKGMTYTIFATAKEGSKTLPISPSNPATQTVTTSTEQKSLAQFINGVYTYLAGYRAIQQEAKTYPAWPGTPFPFGTAVLRGRSGKGKLHGQSGKGTLGEKK